MANRLRSLLLLAGSGVAAALLYAFDPARSALVPPCLFNRLTGLYCPGCGSMRALHAAFHGDLALALDFNALAVFLLPFLFYSLGRMVLPARLWPGLTDRRSGGAGSASSSRLKFNLAAVFERTYSSRLVLAAVLSFWAVRNLPWHPFATLAP